VKLGCWNEEIVEGITRGSGLNLGGLLCFDIEEG